MVSRAVLHLPTRAVFPWVITKDSVQLSRSHFGGSSLAREALHSGQSQVSKRGRVNASAKGKPRSNSIFTSGTVPLDNMEDEQQEVNL